MTNNEIIGSLSNEIPSSAINVNELLDKPAKENGLDILDVMSRIQSQMRARSMAEVARNLGITAQNLNNIVRRGRLPFEPIIIWGKTYGISLNWIMFGSGKPKISDNVEVDHDPKTDKLIELLLEKNQQLESQLNGST